MTELKDGDIYRWRYREEGDDRPYGRYHCCSNIGVVRSGLLRDTYWSCGSEGRTFGPDDFDRLDLTFIANVSDLVGAAEYEADYYDDSDIVNLNHSNSTRGNFYLRKGAKRSQAKMLEVATRKLLQEQSNQRLASLRTFDLRETIAKIEAGHTTVLF
jgi:hypothetical protein